MIRGVAAVVLLLGLAACASPKYVVSDVTRHHSLPRAPSGETYAVVALDDEQSESLAFQSYADVIGARLTGLGLRQFTGQGANPDYVVTLKWSTEGPSPDVKSRNTGFGYGIGWGSRHTHFGYYGGYPYPDNYADAKQVFIRRVELVMYDGATYNTGSPRRVFEGTAVSQGTNSQINPVMPYIIQAVFEQFPGASGSTRTVRVEIPPDAEAATTQQFSSRSSK